MAKVPRGHSELNVEQTVYGCSAGAPVIYPCHRSAAELICSQGPGWLPLIPTESLLAAQQELCVIFDHSDSSEKGLSVVMHILEAMCAQC